MLVRMYSQEQLDKAVRKAVTRARREGLLGYVILIVGVFATYQNGQAVSSKERDAIAQQTSQARAALARTGNALAVEGCNRDFKYAKGVQGILRRSNDSTRAQYERGELSKERFEEANADSKEFLRMTKPPDCRKVRNIISDDPNKAIDIPKPLFEKKNG